MTINAQEVDWQFEAWAVLDAISQLPDLPRWSLLESGDLPPIPESVATRLKLAQTSIALHLSYRISVGHRIKVPLAANPERRLIYVPETMDPDETWQMYDSLRNKLGITFAAAEEFAITAQIRIGRVLADRFCCPEWKRELPLMIACIGGKPSSQINSQAAKTSRKRQWPLLREELVAELKRDRKRPYKSILRALKFEGCVLDWSVTSIQWHDGQDDMETSISTFLRWRTLFLK